MYVINKLTISQDNLEMEWGLLNFVATDESEAVEEMCINAYNDLGEEYDDELQDYVTTYVDRWGNSFPLLDINDGDCEVFRKLREKYDVYQMRVEFI